MLVLTRKAGEALLIGDNIEVIITEISGEKVRIGIQAPTELKILRKELYESIIVENQEAARGPGVKDLQGLSDLLHGLDEA